LWIAGYKRGQDILLDDFIVYSPEISALRTFEKEGQILPLGVRGEGLLKLLRVLASEDKAAWHALQDNLSLLDWLLGIDIDHDNSLPEQSVRIRDRFLATTQPAFDQRSANEGFLYLLFFFALILSKTTPRFFAIENVDTSLNPKACSELMRRLASLAFEHQKQILFTTHNPSLLDGLNLHDDRQRLFVVFRNGSGHTTARRIMPPKPIDDEFPVKLSEAFTRGLLGGIPQNF
jgi:predicted ATPase